jgi:hypothetical protein
MRASPNFTDAERGTFTANSTSAVTVTPKNPSGLKATSIIEISMNTPGGTPAAHPYLSALTAGTSFAVKAGSGDTSVYNYVITNYPSA